MITRKIKIGFFFYSFPRSIQNIAHHSQSLFDGVISEGGGVCMSFFVTQPNNPTSFIANDISGRFTKKIIPTTYSKIPQTKYILSYNSTHFSHVTSLHYCITNVRQKSALHNIARANLGSRLHEGQVKGTLNPLRPSLL